MKFDRLDARIGLLVFTTLGIFLGLVLHRSFATLVKKETVILVRTRTASDIVVGTEVQLQGMRVGQVNAIDLQRDGVEYSFLVRTGIRPDLLLWKGTRAVVVAKILGGAFIDLQLPDVEARKEPLPAGELLVAERSGSLPSLIDSIEDLVRNVDKGVDELRGHLRQKGLGAILDHPAVHDVLMSVETSLKEYANLAKEGQVVAQHGNKSLQGVDKSMAELSQSLAVIRGLLEGRSADMDAIVHNLAGFLKEVEGLSVEVRALLKTAGPAADGSVKALERDLKALEELVQLLKGKPNRILFGTPSATEQEAARKRVEEARAEQARKAEEARKADPVLQPQAPAPAPVPAPARP